MKAWTREERYRSLLEASKEEMDQLKGIVDKCPYRQKFHIQPTTGLLNDPNGFSYYNGEYHIFYQWFPLGPVHGLKHWYHLSSTDLVNWKDLGVAIIPSEYYESHGAFSGSGIVNKDELYLFYTGNTRDENWVRHPYQCLAIMDKEGKITKNKEPIIKDVPKEYTDHFRDPKVFKDNGKFRCIIGAQRKKDNLGTVVYYESENMKDWKFKGEIKTKFLGNGYMWECPDYLKYEDKAVFIFSPQGLKANGDKYNNIFQSGYLIGDKINFDNRILNHGEFNELDRGFDFYAPQSTEDEKGRKILVGWMGLPEIEYPTDKNGWAHCLTLPRELNLINGKLIQTPVRELENLRGACREESFEIENQEKIIEGFNEKAYELICDFKKFHGNTVGIKLKKGTDEETLFYYDIANNKLVLDRSKSGVEFAIEYGTKRKCHYNGDTLKLQIFVDISSIEIFVNDGLEVFTARIFAKDTSTGLSIFSDNKALVDLKLWSY